MPRRPAAATTQAQLTLDGKVVTYTLRRSQRRRGMSLAIDDRGLRVAAPLNATRDRIESLLVEHSGWIHRKLALWETRRPSPLTWKAGTIINVLGEAVELALATAAHTAIDRRGRRLLIAADADAPDAMAKCVTAWMRATALEWFEQRAAHYAPEVAVAVPPIRLSQARTHWGYCSPRGRIHVNWRLIQAPPRLIDYVIVHELAHLREPNHSYRFWRWVEAVLPDYEERRRALRRDARHYLLV
jgi:predicted metal-dependent hydrolase